HHARLTSAFPLRKDLPVFRILFAVICLYALPTAAFGQKNLTVLNTFPGDRGPGTKVLPDNVGGVSEDYVVDFTSANFVVHDKKTGKVLLEKSQTAFWDELGFADISRPNDPRMLYDTLTKRWIATIAHDAVHKLYLAVSTTSDPMKPWKGVLTPF